MAQKLNFAFCFLSGTTCSYKVNGQSISSHFIFLSYVFSLIFSFHLMSVVRLSSVKLYTFQSIPLKEEFEETKGVIRIRISKKNRQHNGHKKMYKRTNNDLQNIHIKLKIE